MINQDQLHFHVDALRHYVEIWYSTDCPPEDKGILEEAAYHVLEHTALLYRYSGDEKVIAGPLRSQGDTKQLLAAAGSYAGQLTLLGRAKRLLAADIIDADELGQLEDLLLQRDSLEAVLWLADRLICDVINDAPKLRQSLCRAHVLAAEIDDLLRSRDDAVSVASRAIGFLADHIVVDLDFRRFWWFREMLDLDREFESEDLLTSLRAQALPAGPTPVAKHEPFASQLFDSTATLQLAAADGTQAGLVMRHAHVAELPTTRIVVTKITPDTYQFVFLEPSTGERSKRLDGYFIAAEAEGRPAISAVVSQGIALLKEAVSFEEIRLLSEEHKLIGNLSVSEEQE